MADDDGFITLPPGIADSGTHRRPRPERTVRPERDEIVFVPAVPGATPALAQPPETEPLPSIPVFTPPPAAAAAPAADDGETRVSVSRHAGTAWRLTIPGTLHPVTVDAPLFLGRNPTATVPNGRTLAIDDTAKSLSKTHALVEVDGGTLYVTDLDSTNGVWVVPAGEDAIEVLPGQRTAVPA